MVFGEEKRVCIKINYYGRGQMGLDDKFYFLVKVCFKLSVIVVSLNGEMLKLGMINDKFLVYFWFKNI